MNRRYLYLFILTVFLTGLSNLTVFGADTKADTKFDLEKQKLLNKLSQFYFYSDDTDEKVIALIEQGQYDAFLEEAFIESFYYRSSDIIDAFINRAKEIKVDILNSEKSKSGWTPLHHAAYARNVYAVNYLLKNGANVQLKTDDGFQPIHLALYLDIYAYQFAAHTDDVAHQNVINKRKIDLTNILVNLIEAGSNPESAVNKITAYDMVLNTKISGIIEVQEQRPLLREVLTKLNLENPLAPWQKMITAMKKANETRIEKAKKAPSEKDVLRRS